MKKNLGIKSLFAIRVLIAVLCVICGVLPAWAVDAKVESVGGTKLGQGAWADMISLAKKNANSVLTLLDDVTIPSDNTNAHVVNQTITIDLNGHTLSGACLANSRYFCLIMYSADKILTIKDSQGGGKIAEEGSYSNPLSGIWVNIGSVVLDHVEVQVTNTHTSSRAIGIEVTSGANATMTGGSIQSTSTGSNYAYGVYGSGVSVISITDVHVSATAKANARALYFTGGEVHITDGTFSATTTTGNTSYAVYSGANITIDGGIYNANSYGTSAYGLYSGAGKITAAGATISASATSTVYGAQAKGTGVENVGELVLNNCTVTATATQGNNAYGVSCTGEENTNYAVCGQATINGGAITATAKTTNALAVYMKEPYISSDGQKKADAELIVRNATLRAETQTGNTAYGIYAGCQATVDGCTITAISGGTSAYGVQLYDGASAITRTTINSNASSDAYGIYARGIVKNGVTCKAVVTADNNTINTTATPQNSYALYAYAIKSNGSVVAGQIIVNGGTYNAQATTEGYAAYCAGSVTQAGEITHPSIIINGGRFKGSSADVSPSGEPGYFVLNGGYYVKETNIDKLLGESRNKVAVKSGTPEYAAGYRFRVTDDMTGETVCKVYNTSNTLQGSFSSLEEALAFVNLPSNSSTALTIVMCANYTLSQGDYVLPGNKTLLVPYLASGTGKGATQAAKTEPQIVNHSTAYISPTPLYKLTFASGVNMTVRSGAVIEASSVLYITNGENGAHLLDNGTGIVHDKYGWIELEQGAHIDLENGAKLFAWGYITGKGEINAKSGSEVYEDFQMGDWRGGNEALEVQGNTNGLGAKGVFLITHYYYQNIECPITYRAGAKAYAKGGVSGNNPLGSGIINAVTNPAVQFVGTDDNSMFQMDPATAGVDTWVRKEYDPETDYVNWFMNSGAELGGLTLQMSSSIMDINVKASDYVLPITSNFNIIANYGDMTIVSDVCFIPGSKLTIKKEADVIIPEGVRAYFYDQDDWSSFKRWWFCPGYSPSWQINPRIAHIGSNYTEKMPDAEVLVEGTLTIQGAAYTTAGGANIRSTRENAGKVMFQANAPASTSALSEFSSSTGGRNKTLCQWVRSEKSWFSYSVYYVGKALTSVKLKNEDNTYTSTTGTTDGQNWIYMEDGGEYRWVLSYDDGCFNMKGGKHYIHPSDWVAVEANASGDHAYHNEDEPRMFINAQGPADEMGCVWWEVNPTPEVIDETTYYVANNDYFDNYGTYFYWEDSEGYWMPKKVTITWNDKDGNKITNSSFGDVYNFNTSPQFYGTDPTWPNTTTEKHEWIGWRDQEGTIYDKNATLPRATSNVTYTAYFVTTKYQSTITFKNDDNTIIWAGLVDHGTVPVCPVEPTKTSTASTDYTFTGWTTEPVAVTGPETYTASYSESTRQYMVTFYSYDAVTELYSVKVDYNTRPTYGGITPFRVNTSAYSYAWTGWQQGETHYGTEDELAQVTGDVFYIATFSQTELQYQVLFKRQDGSIIDAGFYAYGETPAAFPANPTMASTVSTDYSFTGWSPTTLQPVTEDGMTYTAQFSQTTRRYTAHFVNYDGTPLADIPVEYNNVPAYVGETPFKPNNNRNSFEFIGWAWDGGSAGTDEALPALQSDMTFTAQFNPTSLLFNITFLREDGTLIERQQKRFGETTEAPENIDYQDELYKYTFTGWTPATIVNPVISDATYTAHFNRTECAVVSVTISGNTVNYADFNDAWTAAKNATVASTITLLQEVSVTTQLVYNNSGNCTLDLNGHTLTSTTNSPSPLNINRSGITFTITDQSANGAGKLLLNTSSTSTIFGVYVQTGNVVLENGTIEVVSSTATTGGVTVTGSFTMNGGKIHVVTENAKNGRGVYTATSGTATVNGGTVHVEAAAEALGGRLDNTSTIIVNGGMFNIAGSSSSRVVYKKDNTANVTIQGGYYSTDNDLAAYCAMNYHVFPNEDDTYPHKVAEGYTLTWDANGGDALTGDYTSGLTEVGTTIIAPNTPTKTGYTFYSWIPAVAATMPAANTTYTAQWAVAGVTIGGTTTPYTDFNSAWTAANSATSAATITLLQDVSVTTQLVYNNSRNCTLDLNGHTLTSTTDSPSPVHINRSGITFTITDYSANGAGKLLLNTSYTSAIYGVYVQTGNVVLENGTIEVVSSTATTGGVSVTGTFTMNGGKIHIVAENGKNGRGIYTAAYGTATIKGGTVHVEAAAEAQGVRLDQNSTITVNGGMFNIAGSSLSRVVYKKDNTANVTVQGGYYNIDTDLAAYCAPNYQVLENSDPVYRFKVAQGALVINEGETTTIDVNTETTTTIVHVSGTLEVAENVTLTTNDLILEATPSSSGEIIGDVTVNQNAYFDLSQPGGFKARTWYAIAVPWQVEVLAYALCDVSVSNDGETYSPQTLGSTFDLIYYDGARRATGASKAWQYVEDDPAAEHIMVPGRAYMIYLTTNASVIRFRKSTSAVLHTNELDVIKYPSSAGADYADWNGIANPATFKAFLNVGTTENLGQVYVADTKQYTTIHLNSDQLQVGQPLFVQPIAAKTVVAERDIHPSAAPRRAKANVTPFTRYEVALTSADDQEADRIIVRMDEDKETDAYTVGQDLAKMGLSTVVPQMWVNRYHTQLCVNSAFPTNNRADYPLSLFVPKAGEYRLSSLSAESNEQTTLYLTYDGRTIWNLSYAPYSLSLESGTNTHYGLRIVYAPQTATGMENVQNDNVQCTKVLMDDHVFIIRGGNIYTMDGQLVK